MSEIIDKIRQLTEPLLEGSDMFIINIKIKPINNIKLYLDSDSGLSISKSAEINRKLYHIIEEQQMFPDGDFSLEVSSPGVDEPLLQERQYKKNIGRTLLVTPVEGADQLGVLKEVREDKILLEVKVGKKKEIQMVEIPFATIKKTVVQVIF
ncbi:ribosome maturation factor RimP [Polluticoccus soli]|uniref:ribosome maturation factor RimP n=1 Tax=Polluticoccus soli TaxID=3034150 RepID=UPI0023E1AFE9|nr:ribosome maturation factor [Flavipsychrobacter sp. JY13-12]